MADPLLRVRNLTLRFGAADAPPTLRNIAFDLQAGETLALLGESGSGKSLTALSLLRLTPSAARIDPAAEVHFHGENLLHLPESRLRRIRGRRAAMIFQEPMTSLNPLHSIGRQLREALTVHQPLSRRRVNERVHDLLRMVELQQLENRPNAYPHELSGGQRQRVMIAMALANDPDLLIADEPTTALDVTVQAQILDLLKRLQRSLGMAVLFISHDLDVVRRMADRVCVMDRGEIVESATLADLTTAPRHDAARRLVTARFPAPPAPRPGPDEGGDILLRMRGLKVYFPVRKGVFRRTVDHVRAVEDVSLTLAAGRTLGVVGESGSGKTSLALALLRLCPSMGGLMFAGGDIRPLRGAALRALRRRMQPVFQDPFGSLSPRMTIADIVAEGLKLHEPALPARARDAQVCRALEDVRLDPALRHRYPHEFSGGQRQRVALARALILSPDLLVLDEPTSALDRTVQADILKLLRDLQQDRGLAYLLISHDLRVIRALAHDVAVMRGGRVVEQGPAERIFSAPQQAYSRALLAAAFEGVA